MSYISDYLIRANETGRTKKEAVSSRAREYYERKACDSLSYFPVEICGVKTDAMVIDTSEYSVKNINLPHGEKLFAGSIVRWRDSNWLVTDTNQNNVLYDSGKMSRCNYNLRYVDDSGKSIEKLCIITDVTKYLVGEAAKDMITVGDSRMSMTIAKDEDTQKFHRGTRFLVDDADSSETLAYEITKVDRVCNVHNGRGVYKFLIRETSVEESDDEHSMIPDNEGYKPNEGGWF